MCAEPPSQQMQWQGHLARLHNKTSYRPLLHATTNTELRPPFRPSYLLALDQMSGTGIDAR